VGVKEFGHATQKLLRRISQRLKKSLLQESVETESPLRLGLR
jgi:hypothetical protein